MAAKIMQHAPLFRSWVGELQMRTEKKFTPKVLARFQREGRGLGTYADYVPWHRVSRSDPSSHGRSHLLVWRQRQRELLSDGEWTGLNFASMLPGLVDLVEQFPINQEDAAHELSRWQVGIGGQIYPGTQTLARQMGIKHPVATDANETIMWTSTTDLLLVLRMPGARKMSLLAVSCKPSEDIPPRAKQLLLLEKKYWEARGVTWLLITPAQYDKRVGLTLRSTSAWGLAEPASEAELDIAVHIVRSMPFHPYSNVIKRLTDVFGGTEQHVYLAQRALWQSVWRGKLPLDLRRGWRPHLPLTLLPMTDFLALNPIASRRSACL